MPAARRRTPIAIPTTAAEENPHLVQLLSALIEHAATADRAGIEFRVLVPRQRYQEEYAAVEAVRAALDKVHALGVRAPAKEAQRAVDAVSRATGAAIDVFERELLRPGGWRGSRRHRTV